LAALGGLLGATAASGLVYMMARSPQMGLFMTGVTINWPTMLVAVLVGATVGLVSSFVPAFNASRRNIVEGLRHIG